MKTGLCCVLFSIFILLSSPLFSQEIKPTEPIVELSPVYRKIQLGSSMEMVKEVLRTDSAFGYRGDRDVSLLHNPNQTLIETGGFSFIRRSWFQFDNDRLYVMTFSLDPTLLDYHSIYTALVQKYGEPMSLDPRIARWSSSGVTLSLERPLTVKYIEDSIFTEILEASGAGQAASDMVREGFINEF